MNKLDQQYRHRRQQEKKLLSTMRILRYGEKVKIIELRFGFIGSQQTTGNSYSQIAKHLVIRRSTVISVI